MASNHDSQNNKPSFDRSRIGRSGGNGDIPSGSQHTPQVKPRRKGKRGRQRRDIDTPQLQGPESARGKTHEQPLNGAPILDQGEHRTSRHEGQTPEVVVLLFNQLVRMLGYFPGDYGNHRWDDRPAPTHSWVRLRWKNGLVIGFDFEASDSSPQRNGEKPPVRIIGIYGTVKPKGDLKPDEQRTLADRWLLLLSQRTGLPEGAQEDGSFTFTWKPPSATPGELKFKIGGEALARLGRLALDDTAMVAVSLPSLD